MKRRSFIKGILGVGAGLAATKATGIERFSYAESSIKIGIIEENARQLRDAKLLRSHRGEGAFLTGKTKRLILPKEMEYDALKLFAEETRKRRDEIAMMVIGKNNTSV
jgi:hypothetical protein